MNNTRFILNLKVNFNKKDSDRRNSENPGGWGKLQCDEHDMAFNWLKK